eukprot:1177186-Prorocentrum_minimum.AAC.1
MRRRPGIQGLQTRQEAKVSHSRGSYFQDEHTPVNTALCTIRQCSVGKKRTASRRNFLLDNGATALNVVSLSCEHALLVLARCSHSSRRSERIWRAISWSVCASSSLYFEVVWRSSPSSIGSCVFHIQRHPFVFRT